MSPPPLTRSQGLPMEGSLQIGFGNMRNEQRIQINYRRKCFTGHGLKNVISGLGINWLKSILDIRDLSWLNYAALLCTADIGLGRSTTYSPWSVGTGVGRRVWGPHKQTTSTNLSMRNRLWRYHRNSWRKLSKKKCQIPVFSSKHSIIFFAILSKEI